MAESRSSQRRNESVSYSFSSPRRTITIVLRTPLGKPWGWQHPLSLEEVRQAADKEEAWAAKAGDAGDARDAGANRYISIQIDVLCFSMLFSYELIWQTLPLLIEALDFFLRLSSRLRLRSASWLGLVAPLQALDQLRRLERCAHNPAYLGEDFLKQQALRGAKRC